LRARAPGKVVLSGAYAVLAGAPALVAAVDRYAVADTAVSAERVTPEIEEAVRRGLLARAPWFDATALREGAEDRKLGLGSSAAILVAAVGAALLEAGTAGAELATRAFAPALAVHRAAQRGGSGIDVAASAFGGVLRCELVPEGLAVAPHALPPGVVVRAELCPTSASTASMLAAVETLRRAAPERHAAIMAELSDAARAAVAAHAAGDFIEALERQRAGLRALGVAAAVPIVSDDLERLGAAAQSEGACLLPSGAGGGDVALWVGGVPPSAAFARAARSAGLRPLALALGARGLHAVE
jgi:phosphomevalonate kinase